MLTARPRYVYVLLMSKTVPFSMRLDPKLKDELQRLADADHRSLTNYIEMRLREMVEQTKRRAK